MEENEKVYEKWGLKCKKCGHIFLPWHCFALIDEKTNWGQGYYCPKCKNLDTEDNYDKLSHFKNN